MLGNHATTGELLKVMLAKQTNTVGKTDIKIIRPGGACMKMVLLKLRDRLKVARVRYVMEKIMNKTYKLRCKNL